MVRAVVAEATDIPRFDAWYAAEHLPEAKQAFGALRARRCWSRTDPRVHCAFYEFPDAATAEAAIAAPALAVLVAEFDRVWGQRVTRMRELLELAEEI